MPSISINEINKIGEATQVDKEVVVKLLQQRLRDYHEARGWMEQYWRDYYVSYMTTPQAKRRNLSIASQHVGEVNTHWRHNIKSPKAYEITETIVSYFKGAFFPNDRWFDFKPTMPIPNVDYHSIIELNRRFVDKKLRDAQFKVNFGIFLREMVIAGTSGLMFPWANDNVKFKVLSPFEFVLDPDENDPNEANFIRSYTLESVLFSERIKDDTFNLISDSDHREILDGSYGITHTDLSIDQTDLSSIRTLMGMNSEHTSKRNKRLITVFEYWGDLELPDVILKNIRASWTSEGVLLNLDNNPYGKKPFIIGTYLRTSQSPYGIGAIQPISSQLFYKDVLTSRNADNVAVASDTVLEVVMDGLGAVDIDDIYIAPGKKIPVTKPNTINPIAMPYNAGASIQEIQIIEQTADKAIGTGPYIGVGNGRQGERVTAAEVQAQQATGDNRLTDVFVDLEAQVMLPFLKTFHAYCKQFQGRPEILSVQDAYVQVNPEGLQFDFDVIALGANHVADKEYNLRQLTDWLAIVGNNEIMAQTVNWEAVMKRLTYMMLPSYAEDFTSQPKQEGGQANPMDMMSQMQEAAAFAGGQPAADNIQAQAMAGQLPAQAQQLVEGMTNGGQPATQRPTAR